MSDYLFLVPTLRNNFTMDCGAKTIVAKGSWPDFDPEEVDPRIEIVKGGALAAYKLIIRSRPKVVEVTEPLFCPYWPAAVALIYAVKLTARILRFQRPQFVCYSIENLPAEIRVTPRVLRSRSQLSRLWKFGAIRFWGHTSGILDRIAFGTAAAQKNYFNAFGKWLRQSDTSVALIPEQLGTCTICQPCPWNERPFSVLFVAELDARKGADVLLRAWPAVKEVIPKSTLTFVGDGTLREDVESEASDASGISVLGMQNRAQVHGLLSDARVVVLASQRTESWQEQIGRSLLEGEAHGCRLVTTTESGLAEDLRERSKAFIVDPADSSQLTLALIEALSDSSPPVLNTAIPFRIRLESWFLDPQDQDKALTGNSADPSP